MGEILKIRILDYQDTPPSVAATFWWSAERGLTCDNSRLLALMQREGITIPGPRIVYPSDGRLFFDSLRFGFTGLERAQVPIVVEKQEGESL